ITVYIYTDFQCPWCKRAHTHVLDLAHKFEKQVKFVRKDFPLDIACNSSMTSAFHPLACRASYYAKCAGKQNKYWRFHDEIYNNQEILSEETLINISKLLSIDINEMHYCLTSPEIADSIKREIDEGIKYKIDGTPAFRIFGEIIVGAITEDIIKDYLNNYPYITAEILNRIFDNKFIDNVQLLDIREASEYKTEHLLTAINIPIGKLQDRIKELDQSKTVIIYGNDELVADSDKAFNILKNNGVKEILILSKNLSRWKTLYKHKNLISTKSL
ncbi:MAG: thioredoxin domain-containing protein, partial [Oligoflexia bacterium]|nr:thioredoxin domain-containing protein [Oligoflexia bacterium]